MVTLYILLQCVAVCDNKADTIQLSVHHIFQGSQSFQEHIMTDACLLSRSVQMRLSSRISSRLVTNSFGCAYIALAPKSDEASHRKHVQHQ